MPPFTIRKAVRTQRKARVGFCGPAGSGKTYSALVMARTLAGPDGQIVVIDSENASSELYSDEFEFDVLPLEPPYSPDRYTSAIQYCETRYDVVVVDGITQAWTGSGGALEMVDSAGGGNKFSGWRTVTPKHNKMVEAMVQCKAHIIVTMRAKTEYAQEKDGSGKSVIRKLGMAPIQREGMDYEFDLVFDVDHTHQSLVSKTRCKPLTDRYFSPLAAPDCQILVHWLNSAAAPEPESAPEPAALPGPAERTQAAFIKWALEAQGLKDGKEIGAALKQAEINAFDLEKWEAMVAAVEGYRGERVS